MKRRDEQRELAGRRGRNWNSLTRAEKRKRIRFGSHARCHTPEDVRDLARLTGRIAHQRERQALRSWKLNPEQTKRLERLIGFLATDRLIASNKLVRVELAYQLARVLSKLHRGHGRRFYWITLINEDWHSRHDRTVVDIAGITRLIPLVLHPLNMGWIGMIEIDVFNNFPGKGGGLWVMPHGHVLAWSRSSASATALEKKALKQFLRSTLGVKPVLVKQVQTLEDLIHLCFYMTKPNYQCKSMGRLDQGTERRKMYSVEKGVRPGLTLRVSEILSRLFVEELVLASGEGLRIKRNLIRAISRSPAPDNCSDAAAADVGAVWERLMPPRRRSRSRVKILRDLKGGAS